MAGFHGIIYKFDVLHNVDRTISNGDGNCERGIVTSQIQRKNTHTNNANTKATTATYQSTTTRHNTVTSETNLETKEEKLDAMV